MAQLAEKYLTAKQVAACKGVIKRRVLQWIKAGLLEAELIGSQYLIRESAVAAFKRRPAGRPKST